MEQELLGEVFRYLGYRGQAPDEAVRRAAEECLRELEPLLERREVHRTFPLEHAGEDLLAVEGMEIRSRALAKNLADCREVCLMAATIGFAPDRMAARSFAAGKASRAVIVQAAGAALIEAWCDQVNERIRQEALEKGLYPLPRFSPGYGDFGLEHQRELFRILQVSKSIGVTLTESLLMQPSKSVTALVGLSGRNLRCRQAGCEVCSRAAECSFRRN